MQSAKKAKTTGASTDNKSEHRRLKDKSLQPEEKLETSTDNEKKANYV